MRFILLIIIVFGESLSQAGELLVISSSQVPVSKISIEQLADIYTLKKNYWANKTQVVPINREATSDERNKFSEAVFDLSPQEMAEYMNRLRFQGKLPPLVQTSDQAVLGFVRSVPGAIGYVNSIQIPDGVKILMRLP